MDPDSDENNRPNPITDIGGLSLGLGLAVDFICRAYARGNPAEELHRVISHIYAEIERLEAVQPEDHLR
jgi:fatty acid-binding protein DegV